MYHASYTENGGPQPLPTWWDRPHITDTLQNEIESGRIWHMPTCLPVRGEPARPPAPRFWPRRSTAYIRSDGDPCGECEVCRGIDDGSVLDVVEIDAASNNGVDNIRDLREEANFTPAVGKIPGLYHRRGAHALDRGVQRPAQNVGGAARACSCSSWPPPRSISYRQPSCPAASDLTLCAFPLRRLQTGCSMWPSVKTFLSPRMPLG